MKGIHVAALVGLTAAAAVLALRWLSPAPVSDFTAEPAARLASASYDARDGAHLPARIGLSGGAATGVNRGEPESPPREDRRESAGHRADSEDRSQLVEAVERHRDVLDAVRSRGEGAAASAPSDDALALGGAAGSTAHSPAHDLNPPVPPDDQTRHASEVADDSAKTGATDDLVLSIPLKGDVKPEVGGAAIQADGLVSKGGEIEFPDTAQLSFPAGGTVNSKAGTISFDVQPQWSGADQTNNSLVQIRDQNAWDNSLEVVKNNDALRYIIHDSQGVEYNVNVPIDDWSPGEERHVTATWTDTSMALYVDGQLVGQTALTNPVTFGDSTPVHIGSDFPGASYGGAGGTISSFKLFGRALDAGEVAGL